MSIILSRLLPDPIDSRDWLFDIDFAAKLPKRVSLRQFEPPIENQEKWGLCSSNAWIRIGEMYLVAGGRFADLSRMFADYNSKALLDISLLLADTGTTSRSTARALNKLGTCRESTYPYVQADFAVQPPASAYVEATDYRLGAYRRIPNIRAAYGIRYALAKGYPVVIGLRIGSQFPTLDADEVYLGVGFGNTPIGGHELVIDGYEVRDNQAYYGIANSWGTRWSNGGYGVITADVIANDLIDCWVPMAFAGIQTCGPDLTDTGPLLIPGRDSTFEDATRFFFQKNFGRQPLQAGLDFWAQATLDYIEPHIIAAASPADKAYMDAHNLPD